MSWREMEAYMGRPVPSDVLQRWADEWRRLEHLWAGVPGDWDGESHCTECGRPAAHERPVGVIAGMLGTEWLCCVHARPVDDCPPRGIERPEVAA